MCGRYTLLAQTDELAAEFDLVEPLEFDSRYNIAPTQDVPVVRYFDAAAAPKMTVVRVSESTGERRMDILRWGLIPHWAKDTKFAYRTINARAETVAKQPAFREAFRKRRCILPANGFFEWEKVMVKGKEVKQPHYIRRADGRPLALAGLWEHWEGPDGKVIESFTIITTTANDILSSLHDRMPVILDRADYEIWLSPDSKPDDLQALLKPCPSEWLVSSPVSRHVNNPRNDDPGCIEEAS